MYGYPPEPEWEGKMEITCSSEVHRRMITPKMEAVIRSFSETPADPWAESRTPEQVEQQRVRMMESRIAELKREWSNIEPMDRTCGYEGEADVYVDAGRMFWTCPACGEEHDDPYEPDVPEPYDTIKEAWGLA